VLGRALAMRGIPEEEWASQWNCMRLSTY
jgi:hypothetical protein